MTDDGLGCCRGIANACAIEGAVFLLALYWLL